MSTDTAPARIVVMGVSAAGKTTVGRGVASALGFSFIDADDLHPAANVAKMASGVPLTDADRAPWLDAVGGALAGSDGVVVACSALRRVYRDRIRDAAPDAFFVFLDADPAILRARIAARSGHFMPPALLDSQLATLEPLEPDEAGMRVDVASSPESAISFAVAALQHP
ncbi:gluconokinase [Microbacterium sp. CJ88]|uniref:gluconokinase n=1 Tax=Microbacterium sp. CJ88 TaxID=3445672 RepID=UPI003F65E023